MLLLTHPLYIKMNGFFFNFRTNSQQVNMCTTFTDSISCSVDLLGPTKLVGCGGLSVNHGSLILSNHQPNQNKHMFQSNNQLHWSYNTVPPSQKHFLSIRESKKCEVTWHFGQESLGLTCFEVFRFPIEAGEKQNASTTKTVYHWFLCTVWHFLSPSSGDEVDSQWIDNSQGGWLLTVSKDKSHGNYI